MTTEEVQTEYKGRLSYIVNCPDIKILRQFMMFKEQCQGFSNLTACMFVMSWKKRLFSNSLKATVRDRTGFYKTVDKQGDVAFFCSHYPEQLRGH